MVSTSKNDGTRPVWIVSGGEQWRQFTQFWQHREIGCDHLDTIADMRPRDRIALKTDRFRLVRIDESGNGVASVGIWAIGDVEKLDGHRVYVNWYVHQDGPLLDARVNAIHTRFPETKCIWEMRPDDEATSKFIAEVFELEALSVAEGEFEPSLGTRTKPVPQSQYTIDSIVDEGCFLDKHTLRTMLERLQTKQNLILQGPPGTGKTWLAKKLAYALIGRKDDHRVRPMQFHPNLSYEDFVRGWRPQGNGQLALVDGPFLRVVEDARKNPNNDYVIVIEEINRGNPASIFGEMLTLLEADKRNADEALALAYPREIGERVHIPPNVYVIGTMNLADRSLAMVDLALRRRFAFFDLEPMLNDIWRDWAYQRCNTNGSFVDDIKERITALNEQVAADRNLGRQFRIGHSFVTPGPKEIIDEPAEWFAQIVETEIVPLLHEYWFDNPDKVADARSKLLGTS